MLIPLDKNVSTSLVSKMYNGNMGIFWHKKLCIFIWFKTFANIADVFCMFFAAKLCRYHRLPYCQHSNSFSKTYPKYFFKKVYLRNHYYNFIISIFLLNGITFFIDGCKQNNCSENEKCVPDKILGYPENQCKPIEISGLLEFPFYWFF